VTIMDFGHGVFQVVSTSGDTQLGGRDMDKVLMDYVLEEFQRESGIDLRNDRMAMIRSMKLWRRQRLNYPQF